MRPRHPSILVQVWTARVLKRIAVALERQNSLIAQRLALEYPEWHESRSALPKNPRAKDFSQTDVQKLSKQWRDKHGLIDYDDLDGTEPLV